MSVYLLLLFLFAKHLMRRWKAQKGARIFVSVMCLIDLRKSLAIHTISFSVYFRVEGTLGDTKCG